MLHGMGSLEGTSLVHKIEHLGQRTKIERSVARAPLVSLENLRSNDTKLDISCGLVVRKKKQVAHGHHPWGVSENEGNRVTHMNDGVEMLWGD